MARNKQPDAQGEPAEVTTQPDPGAAAERSRDSAQLQRAIAKQLFNGCWDLLERADRGPEDDARMLHMAHASAYHWSVVGQPVNWVRGEWQCSRVYAVLGRGEPALWHARRALNLARQHGVQGLDLAYCYEAMARAYAVNGELMAARRWVLSAKGTTTDISDPDDRALVLADLDTIPTQ